MQRRSIQEETHPQARYFFCVAGDMIFAEMNKKYCAIKLYSIGSDQENIDRPNLVDSVLSVFHDQFNEMPLNFDIHGPYGIKKGTTVKLEAFKNKLEKYGHNKYYALDGYSDGRLGFSLQFDAKINDATYTELIIWYSNEEWNINFKNVVDKVKDSLSLSSGYEIEIGHNCDIQTENRIKKGLLGGISLKITCEHLEWITDIEKGSARGIFAKNMWTEKQLKKASSSGKDLKYSPVDKLYYVEYLSSD